MGSNLKEVSIMDTLLGLVVLFLIGIWPITTINGNQYKPKNNEKFIGYINRYDDDGEPNKAEVWKMSEDAE